MVKKVHACAPFHKVNKESLRFLMDHDFLPNKMYFSVFELQMDLEGIREFISYNVKQVKKGTEVVEEYDSMFFAVVEYHLKNTITICG